MFPIRHTPSRTVTTRRRDPKKPCPSWPLNQPAAWGGADPLGPPVAADLRAAGPAGPPYLKTAAVLAKRVSLAAGEGRDYGRSVSASSNPSTVGMPPY